MRKLIAAALLLAASPVLAGEVLVLTTVTRIDPSPRIGRQGIEIQNLGPNAIYCQPRVSTGLVVNKGRKIVNGEAWGFIAGANVPVYCIAATANQVTTAATIVTEVP